MNWMVNRFARLRRVPKQQGAHVRGPDLPKPRAASDRVPGLSEPVRASVATVRVLIAAHDDDVRFLLTRRCEMSPLLQVVGETKEPVSSLRAAHRLRPDLIVVQVRSTSPTEAGTSSPSAR